MNKYWLFVILAVLFAKVSIAQKEASVWYFGHNGGVDFSSGTPVPLLNGQIYTDEGVASICNSNGQLLFYTEGTTVWNANHSIMPNGTGLFGSFSSSQSAIIVPKINDPLRYYVFTTDQLGLAHGLNYSIVNMSLDNGLGDVEVKNQPLQTPVCEKLTAVKHCNGKDIWVIVHGFNSDAFDAYLVSASGVSITPVISHAGTFISSSNPEFAIGCMKASPDGKKIAAAHHHIGLDLLDFDNSTGIVSNGRSLFLPGEGYTAPHGPYGVEFSPNSKLLYTCLDDYYNSILLQYNVSLPSLPAIQASKYVVYVQQSYWAAENFGSLQMAIDGKMYMAEFEQHFISTINNPDLTGAACQFVHGQVYLPYNNTVTPFSTYGLPSFIQSYWSPVFTFRGECSGNLINFDYEKPIDVNSVKWDFGDPASGANNISFQDSTQHLFSSEGIYNVKLILFKPCGNDTVIKQVKAGNAQISLGRDTVLCGLNQYIIIPQVTSTNPSYTWQNGSTNSTLTATNSGLYWLELKNNNNGCIKRDSIVLDFRPLPSFDLGPDLNKCVGDTVVVSAFASGTSYLWNDGTTNSSIKVFQTGLYWVEGTLNSCVKKDTIQIVFNQYPSVNFGKDTTLCEDETLLLNAQNSGMQYLWQDHSTTQLYNVINTGMYWVSVNNNGCVKGDTINVSFLLKPAFTLGKDTGICNGMTITLRPKIEAGSNLNYLWNNGSSSNSISVTQSGDYYLTISNTCGTITDTIQVLKGICQLYVPNAFTPDKNGLNDTFKASFGENITEFDLRIYNRWGELVFESKDIQKGWDGNYKGIIQNSALFVWAIKYKTISDSKEKLIKGTVMLIR